MSKYTLPFATSIHSVHPSTTLTNQQFYVKCAQLGSTAKTAVGAFLALLPEAEERQVYLDHGMRDIFEFAAKVGGISKEQVQRVLQLNKRYTDTPLMQELLLSGKVSVHKLARVASVVTPNNQEFWASKTQLLSSQALATLVKDSVHVHSVNPNKTAKVPQSDELQLSPKIRERLLTMQNKGLNLNNILEDLLDQREEQIQQELTAVGGEMSTSKATGNTQKTASRYIPAKVKRILKQEFGAKCSMETCTNVSTTIHHTRRFSLNLSHNPLYLAPLCKSHHEIAHSIDLKVSQRKRWPHHDNRT